MMTSSVMITTATAMITAVGEFCDGVLTAVSKWSMLLHQIVHLSNMYKHTLHKLAHTHARTHTHTHTPFSSLHYYEPTQK